MVPIIDAAHIIPFKMKAWLDLSHRKLAGEQVDSRNIRKYKHAYKHDVFRLAGYVSEKDQVEVSTELSQDIREFCDAMKNEAVDMKQLGLL